MLKKLLVIEFPGSLREDHGEKLRADIKAEIGEDQAVLILSGGAKARIVDLSLSVGAENGISDLSE